MRTPSGPSAEIAAMHGDALVRPRSVAGNAIDAPPPFEIDASFAFCRDVSRLEAGNFYWSFRLLPRDARRAMCALYAFMRHTDDLADAEGPVDRRADDLNRWRECLASVLDAGDDSQVIDRFARDWPGFPALAHTVRHYGIPTKYLHAVIDGMAFDLGPVRIRDTAEFERYCWHVASAVGLCCLHIWGYESHGGRAEALAERLGLAFQRTNILRDVAEDFALNRIYLPADDLARHGVTDSDLAARTATEPLKALVAEHVARARREYRAVDELLPLISPGCRPMLRAIARIYEAVLDTIVRQHHDVLMRRASIPKWRKAAIMIGAVLG